MKKLTRRTLISLAALLPVIRVNAAVSGRFDVIVVGAGIAGLAAAVSAAENGAKRVLVLEKGPMIGGHAIYADGTVSAVYPRLQKVFNIKDSPELMAKQIWEWGDRDGDLSLIRVISQLSSMIAHELKQPLASILNYANGLAQLAKMGRSTPEQTGFAVKSIKTEATRANAIVDRVRAYAKHEEGPLTELDLSDVSHKAIRTFTRNALTPVAVSDAIEPGIRVMGHELELELLTLNLIRNAGDAVKDVADPLIRVTLRRDGGKAVFQVRDNGPVVTDAVLEKLTEIEESVKPEGLGLGLAIVRDIADRHGASLSFRRNDDTGLTAEMRIDMVESKPRDTEEKTGPKGDAS